MLGRLVPEPSTRHVLCQGKALQTPNTWSLAAHLTVGPQPGKLVQPLASHTACSLLLRQLCMAMSTIFVWPLTSSGILQLPMVSFESSKSHLQQLPAMAIDARVMLGVKCHIMKLQ